MNKLVPIAGGSTLIYLALAVTMGVLPGIELSRTPPGPGVEPLTPLQAQGRDVYVASGCSYCHTQQVRPLPEDAVFGRPSAPGDFFYQTPELLGSERTGPDLTNVGMRQPSTVWQYIHLYNPRAVVPQSVMPSFGWLFRIADQAPPGETPVPLPTSYAPTHGVVVPTHQAKVLIAYLLSLKQAALADEGSASSAPSASINGAAAPGAPVSAGTTAAAGYDSAKGQALFTADCAACHQATGEGLPGAFPALKDNEVVNNDDAGHHIHVVLYGLQGEKVAGIVYSSPMPPFGTALSDADIANIIDYERASWGNHGARIAAGQVAAERAKGK
jgi:cytochrome c oxidase cbb3-type subunit II